jgi:hypothetical protein
VQIISDLQNYMEYRSQNLLFKFEGTTEACLHNAMVLGNFNFDLSKAILAQNKSQVMFGSEFKDPSLLEELLKDHLNWSKLRQILSSGAEFSLEPLSNDDRIQDLEYHLNRSNHKSALKNSRILDDLINKDIRHGFALPLPIETYKEFKNTSIAPLGCQEQETINAQGEHVPKYRMTHDQTFPGPLGKSVNLRVIKEAYIASSSARSFITLLTYNDVLQKQKSVCVNLILTQHTVDVI